MAITAADVKALREATDLPMMECKQALVEADGDHEKAIEILREKSGSKIAKRADNPTSEGQIFVLVKDDGSEAAMVEIQTESEPVGKGADITTFGTAMVTQLLNGPGAETPEDLLSQDMPDGGTFAATWEEMTHKLRENMKVARVARVTGPVGGYLHHDKKNAVLFVAEATGDSANPTDEVLRDVGMHIAALRPTVCHPEELDASTVEAERNRLSEEAKATGKPDNIIEKIVDGRMKNFFVESGVLTAQPFAKDDAKSVSQALAERGFAAKSFVRWVIGN